jgi:hypothetical protein
MNNARSSSDTVELLRRANPHARHGLIDQRNASEAVARIIERARNDWDTPTRCGRRLTVALVALVLLVLLVAPALALRSNIVSFFTSPKPSQTVETVVYQMAQGAPAGMDPGLIPNQARVVTSMRINGVQRDLWVAPTKAGGLCYGWVGLGGGCDKFGTIPLNVSWGRTADGGAIAHIDGFIHSRYADRLELHFANGEIVRPPLTQVTAPIDAAFFSVDLPQEKQDASHALTAVTAVNSHGDVISTQEAPITSLGRPNPLLDAEMENKTRDLVTETAAGKAAIFTAPTRYGGRCIWLELAAKLYLLAPCEPARYSFDPFSIQPITTDKAVILAGTITGKIELLQIRFADGDQIRVKPNGDGLLLYSIPAQHLTLGHEAQLVTGLDASGAELTSYRLPPNGRCYSSMPQAIPADCPNARLP